MDCCGQRGRFGPRAGGGPTAGSKAHHLPHHRFCAGTADAADASLPPVPPGSARRDGSAGAAMPPAPKRMRRHRRCRRRLLAAGAAGVGAPRRFRRCRHAASALAGALTPSPGRSAACPTARRATVHAAQTGTVRWYPSPCRRTDAIPWTFSSMPDRPARDGPRGSNRNGPMWLPKMPGPDEATGRAGSQRRSRRWVNRWCGRSVGSGVVAEDAGARRSDGSRWFPKAVASLGEPVVWAVSCRWLSRLCHRPRRARRLRRCRHRPRRPLSANAVRPPLPLAVPPVPPPPPSPPAPPLPPSPPAAVVRQRRCAAGAAVSQCGLHPRRPGHRTRAPTPCYVADAGPAFQCGWRGSLPMWAASPAARAPDPGSYTMLRGRCRTRSLVVVTNGGTIAGRTNACRTEGGSGLSLTNSCWPAPAR